MRFHCVASNKMGLRVFLWPIFAIYSGTATRYMSIPIDHETYLHKLISLHLSLKSLNTGKQGT